MAHSVGRHAYRWFGKAARRQVARTPRISVSLQRAHIAVRPDVYVSSALLLGFTATGATLLIVLVALALDFQGAVSFPPLVPAFLPDLRALTRSRDIEAKLPYALNYLATMASAGATPEVLFATLAKQPIYGEVAREAEWVVRDLRMLGMDVITAMQRAIDRSPSAKFQDLLQGTVTALTSGGDLKTYFVNKADQFLVENRQEQKRFLDGLGVLAESFVTVVVAAPLFLIVILSVMTSFGGSPEQTLVLGYSLVFILIPLSQLGFGWTVKVMTPEA